MLKVEIGGVEIEYGKNVETDSVKVRLKIPFSGEIAATLTVELNPKNSQRLWIGFLISERT